MQNIKNKNYLMGMLPLMDKSGWRDRQFLLPMQRLAQRRLVNCFRRALSRILSKNLKYTDYQLTVLNNGIPCVPHQRSFVIGSNMEDE